jgi:hypothetical protein
VEGAHEVREVAEANVEGDLGDAAVRAAEQARGATQPRAHQVLVWRHPEDFREEPQEVEGAQAHLLRGAFEIDAFVGVRVDPERGFHRAAAVSRPRVRRPLLPAGHDVHEAHREPQRDLVQAGVGAALGRGLGELSQQHELGERRNHADAPDLAPASDRLGQLRSQVEGQALVAAGVVLVGADVLVARVADEERSRHQLELPPARAVAEAAPTHVGDVEARVPLGEGRVARPGAAAAVAHA